MAAPLPPERQGALRRFLAGLGLGPWAERCDLAPVEEALTHTSAGRAQNHERLEFLGDAVLRLAAAEYLERHHGELSVGRRSALRAQLVSDAWLADLGAACGIGAVQHLGRDAARDRAARRTLEAEACEALIGALYVGCGSLEPVHRWLTPHWRRSSDRILADPHHGDWKTALQEWSQGRGLGLPHYSCRERDRGHGDPGRFHCRVAVAGQPLGEGEGRSRRAAQQQAARAALAGLDQAEGRPAPQRSQ